MEVQRVRKNHLFGESKKSNSNYRRRKEKGFSFGFFNEITDTSFTRDIIFEIKSHQSWLLRGCPQARAAAPDGVGEANEDPADVPAVRWQPSEDSRRRHPRKVQVLVPALLGQLAAGATPSIAADRWQRCGGGDAEARVELETERSHLEAPSAHPLR